MLAGALLLLLIAALPAQASTRTVAVIKKGGGSGRVLSSPPGIDCGSVCEATFADEATLTAIPFANSVFAGWDGCPGAAGGQCFLMGPRDQTIGAVFVPRLHTLALSKAGSGNGTFECDSGSGLGPCAAQYKHGTTITISAVANSRSTFAGWSGSCSAPCAAVVPAITLTINAATSVTGTFDRAQRALAISKAGTGDGTFECDSGSGFGACAASYADGSTITIKGIPDSRSTLAGWSGGGCSGAGECSIADIAVDSAVTLVFQAMPSPIPIGGVALISYATPLPLLEVPGSQQCGRRQALKRGRCVTDAKRSWQSRRRAVARCKQKKGRARSRCLRQVT